LIDLSAGEKVTYRSYFNTFHHTRAGVTLPRRVSAWVKGCAKRQPVDIVSAIIKADLFMWKR